MVNFEKYGSWSVKLKLIYLQYVIIKWKKQKSNDNIKYKKVCGKDLPKSQRKRKILTCKMSLQI